MVEGDRGSMIVVPVSDEASIAVLLEKEARIGVALYAGKGAAQEIRVIPEGNASSTLQPDLDPAVSAYGCRWQSPSTTADTTAGGTHCLGARSLKPRQRERHRQYT